MIKLKKKTNKQADKQANKLILSSLLLCTMSKQTAVSEQRTPMKALEGDTGSAHTL